MAWQPIETAPKDGSKVLTWDGERFGVTAYEEAYQTGSNHPWNCATHWMPLPEPPDNEKEHGTNA